MAKPERQKMRVRSGFKEDPDSIQAKGFFPQKVFGVLGRGFGGTAASKAP
jgi:hypothetical protein